MPLRHIDRLEPCRGKKRPRTRVHVLPVLHRAGGVVSNTATAYSDGGGWPTEPKLGDHLCHVAGKRCDKRRLFGIGRIFAQHKAIILDHGTATRGIDYDSVESNRTAFAFLSIDIGTREAECCRLSP